MLKIYFLSNHDLLRPTTNRISDIRFCEGFAENGCDVQMTVPYFKRDYNIDRSSILEVYGIEYPFDIEILPTPFRPGTPKGVIAALLLSFVAWDYLKLLMRERGHWNELIVISRDVNMLIPVLLINKMFGKARTCVIAWAHEVKSEKTQYVWAYRQVDAILGTNSAIIDDLRSTFGYSEARLAITLNPISTRQLQSTLTKEKARSNLKIDPDQPLVVYTGKVGQGVQEIYYILDAAARLPKYTFLLTGGKPEAVSFFEAECAQRGIMNVVFTGFLNQYTEILQYQVAADVLISYYSRHDHMVDYNYPQKITEYMLTGNPIVTPNFRATRDVLNVNNAIFVEPEQPRALAEGIQRAMEDQAMTKRLGEQAQRDVQDYTFKKRTRMLMDFFETIK